MKRIGSMPFLVIAALAGVMGLAAPRPVFAQQKPNIVILMTDDTGWNDFGAYDGGATWAIRLPISIASPKKVPYSPVGMARQVAPRAGLP